VPAPSIDPSDLDPDHVAPADSYRPADPVWVYRGGEWIAGVVVAASRRSATVTYRPTEGPGTAIDMLTAPFLSPRADSDPRLDAADPTGTAPVPSRSAGPPSAAGTSDTAAGS